MHHRSLRFDRVFGVVVLVKMAGVVILVVAYW